MNPEQGLRGNIAVDGLAERVSDIMLIAVLLKR